MNMILRDRVQITPDQNLVGLSKDDKHKLMDVVLESTSQGRRGLKVDFYLSHAGRRINNRIYSTKGQREGISSLTSPYPKPLIRHHDESADPFGRFIGGTYEDISAGAGSFFSKTNDVVDLHNSLEGSDFEKTSALLHKSGLLMNPRWPGLGRMHVSARVTDQDAIEKFLDGRYLTFSGGFETDHMVCSHCLNDWRQGDICDHRPGTIVDGKPVVMLCGTYSVREASVEHEPADDLSQVTSLEMIDMKVPESLLNDACTKQDATTIILTDSVMGAFQEEVVKTSLADSWPKTVKEILDLFATDAANYKKLTDDLNGETFLETQALIQLHDGLHSQRDYMLKYPEESATEVIPLDCFKLHAKLHDIATSGGFRDSFLNGPLDNYSAGGEETGEFLYKQPTDEKPNKELSDATEEPIVPVKVESESALVTKDETKEEKVEAQESQEDEEEVDWVLLDNELQVELGDAKLSTEARKKLGKSTFCGPGRSFPVPDCNHVSAARRLVGRADVSESTRAKILSCVNDKAKSLGCDKSGDTADRSCNCEELNKNSVPLDKYTSLNQDYANALNQVQNLKLRLEGVLDSYAKEHNKIFEVVEGQSLLDVLDGWFEEVHKISEEPAKKIKLVENPSIATSDTKENPGLKNLEAFEKQIVEQYKDIFNQHGVGSAELWFRRNTRYLSRGFHPKNYL